LATLSNLMKTSPKVNEQVATNKTDNKKTEKTETTTNKQKIDSKQDKERHGCEKKNIQKMGGKRRPNKDANPLKYPAMIAPQREKGKKKMCVGELKRRREDGRAEKPEGGEKNTREPLKVIMKDSQFVKWNFMA